MRISFGVLNFLKKCTKQSLSSTSDSKYLLCVTHRLVFFQNDSIGLSSGEYGGKNNNSILSLTLSKYSLFMTAWWNLALSKTNKIFLSVFTFFIILLTNSLKLIALNISDFIVISCPVNKTYKTALADLENQLAALKSVWVPILWLRLKIEVNELKFRFI